MALALAEALLVAVAALVLVPVAVLFGEILLGVTRSRGGSRDGCGAHGERPSLAVLIPAHNEAPILAPTLRSILPQLRPHDRLVVVADNCSDATAAIARTEGAEVIERNDSTRKGKGYALDYGIRHLQPKPPDAVVVVDADCNLSEGALDRLSRECLRTARPIQSLYLMYAPNGAGLKTRIAQFAFAVKNHVRPTGLHRLDLPCQLMGTGMAFPWPLISGSRLATSHIVEDLKLGIELAHAGFPPRFCPEAVVTSQFPASDEGIRSQRTRWEHGHLSVALSEAPRLLVRSLVRADARLAALALDLSVPPLALLSLIVVALWSISAALYAGAGMHYPLYLTTAALVMLVVSVLLAWARFGRRMLSLRDLLLAPVYALWKVPLYLRFLRARQAEWVRSKRDTDEP